MNDDEQNDSLNNEAPQKPRNASPKWIRVALFASLALNLLVVGAVVGAVMRNDGRHGRPAEIGAGINSGLGPYAQALTQPQRKELAKAIAGQAGPLGDNAKALRAQVRKIVELVRAPEFDADQLAAELQQAQTNLTQRQSIALSVVVDQIAKMNAQERESFANRLERSFKRKPPRRRD